jgi:hypothetical protein
MVAILISYEFLFVGANAQLRWTLELNDRVGNQFQWDSCFLIDTSDLIRQSDRTKRMEVGLECNL